MLDLLIWILWFILGAYTFWFFTQAKKLQPLTLDELVILWKLHKQETGCTASISKVELIMNSHSNEFVGFECECSYRYLSKRLITQRDACNINMFHHTPAKNKDINEVVGTRIHQQI